TRPVDRVLRRRSARRTLRHRRRDGGARLQGVVPAARDALTGCRLPARTACRERERDRKHREDAGGPHGAFSRNRNNASLYSSGRSKYGECPACGISTNVAFARPAAMPAISGAGKRSSEDPVITRIGIPSSSSSACARRVLMIAVTISAIGGVWKVFSC